MLGMDSLYRQSGIWWNRFKRTQKLLNILIWPNPILKQISEPVMEPLNPEYINSMYCLMAGAGGVGLAAIQVGLAKRFFIINTDSNRVCVNPVIKTYIGKPVLLNEGCLSVPGQFETVKRFPEVEVSYWLPDLSKEITEVLYGLDAHVFQHEYEHLDGMLFVDKLSSAKRSTIRGNLQKMKKQGKTIKYVKLNCSSNDARWYWRNVR